MRGNDSSPIPVEHIVDRESRIMTEAAPGSQDPPSPSLKTMTVIKPHGIHPFGETQTLRKMRIQAVCYFFVDRFLVRDRLFV